MTSTATFTQCPRCKKYVCGPCPCDLEETVKAPKPHKKRKKADGE